MRKLKNNKKNLMGQIPLEKEFRGFGALRSIVNRLLHAFARYSPMYPGWRVKVHRLRGVKIGCGVFIGSDVFIDNTYPESIIIEDFVTIISRSIIIGHNFTPFHLKNILCENSPQKKGVLMSRGCYIGAQCIILPGVTIGECAIIGAGSVVTHDIPAFSIAMGSPARVREKFKKESVIFTELTLK
jgi:acetyltransferase-like isoleucine patch superfamily enzyme